MTQNLPEDQEPMQPGSLNDAITNALERHPRVDFSAGFAARVMSNLPTKKAVRETKHVARTIAFSAVSITAFALLIAVGAHPLEFKAGMGFTFLVEMGLFAEVLAVGLWLGLSREA